MSITPVSASARISKKNSPRPLTTLCLPFTTLSSRANSVAHRGRFSMSERYANTRSLDAGRTVVTVRDFKVDHSLQHRLQASVVGGGERCAHEGVELAEHALDDGLECPSPRRQEDERRPPVVGMRRAANEAVALEQADHRRHRLLAQPRSGRELAHAQAVLLEEGDQ